MVIPVVINGKLHSLSRTLLVPLQTKRPTQQTLCIKIFDVNIYSNEIAEIRGFPFQDGQILSESDLSVWLFTLSPFRYVRKRTLPDEVFSLQRTHNLVLQVTTIRIRFINYSKILHEFLRSSCFSFDLHSSAFSKIIASTRLARVSPVIMVEYSVFDMENGSR